MSSAMIPNQILIERLAESFTKAFYDKHWPSEPALSVNSLSLAEAYAVQDRVEALRMERGEELAGYKVGCTSNAIRRQFGLDEPISARLFHPHIYSAGATFCRQDFIKCAIEPEMVISVGVDLQGVGLSDDELLDSMSWVGVGIELHHFKFWFDPPSSQELICSGGIHAGLMIGNAQIDPRQISFQRERFSVIQDGHLVTQADATEIMGGPLHSLRWLVDSLTRRGQYLAAGSLVIPGSPVELVSINRDCEIRVVIEGVGELLARFHSQ